MKLFTKYLPVEGERKIGDTVIHQGNPPVEITASNESLLCPDCKKVKLFLCTKDIQVGDKYYPHQLWFEKDKDKPLEWNNNHLITEHCFKVIGEISPAAIWVKEGIEFDEKDVRIHCWYNEITGNDVYQKNKDGQYVYEIKCSQCNTYH